MDLSRKSKQAPIEKMIIKVLGNAKSREEIESACQLILSVPIEREYDQIIIALNDACATLYLLPPSFLDAVYYLYEKKIKDYKEKLSLQRDKKSKQPKK